jgi:hypothetical protein
MIELNAGAHALPTPEYKRLAVLRGLFSRLSIEAAANSSRTNHWLKKNQPQFRGWFHVVQLTVLIRRP